MLVLRNSVLTKADLDIHKEDLVVHVTGSVGEQGLFNELKQKLSLPSYFGDNWDALDEVMRDFEWIPNKKIILIHEKVPSLPEEDLKIYLDILQEAVKVHLERGTQELVVAFPEEDEDLLSSYYKVVLG